MQWIHNHVHEPKSARNTRTTTTMLSGGNAAMPRHQWNASTYGFNVLSLHRCAVYLFSFTFFFFCSTLFHASFWIASVERQRPRNHCNLHWNEWSAHILASHEIRYMRQYGMCITDAASLLTFPHPLIDMYAPSGQTSPGVLMHSHRTARSLSLSPFLCLVSRSLAGSLECCVWHDVANPSSLTFDCMTRQSFGCDKKKERERPGAHTHRDC